LASAGATLAACLAGGGADVAASLRRHERLRVPRTSRIQAMSTTNKTRFHLQDGPDQRRRNAERSAGSTDWSFQAVAWIYAHNAASARTEHSPEAG
jgi:salicylate hydroxylase